jgi:uncharacterized protein YutE (UPF0331/DUF86 family)
MVEDIGFLELRRDQGVSPGDAIVMRAVKYAFITAIEAAIDTAQHLCASEGWGPPGTNAESFVLLARHDVLSEEVAGHLADASGFRNVLVHDYVKVDDQRVVAHLDRLSDLRRFCSEVAGWLAGS